MLNKNPVLVFLLASHMYALRSYFYNLSLKTRIYIQFLKANFNGIKIKKLQWNDAML